MHIYTYRYIKLYICILVDTSLYKCLYAYMHIYKYKGESVIIYIFVIFSMRLSWLYLYYCSNISPKVWIITDSLLSMYIYIYIYVFFNPVNPELGTIQLGQIKYSNLEYLDIPGKELNVDKIHRANNIFSRKKTIFVLHRSTSKNTTKIFTCIKCS